MKEIYILATKEKYGSNYVNVMAFEKEQDAQQVAQQFDGWTVADVFALPYVRNYDSFFTGLVEAVAPIEAADDEGR